MTTAIDYRKILFCSLITMTFVLLTSGAAFAQSGAGVRAGISADPEQVYFGVHANVGEIIPELMFRPNAEVGIGDGVTVVTLNGEFVYHFKISSREWSPYVGAGPGVVIATASTGAGRVTNTGPGFNFLMGIEQKKGFLAEIKVGAIDSPGFKLGFGWNFSGGK
jgi:hypothetical protein